MNSGVMFGTHTVVPKTERNSQSIQIPIDARFVAFNRVTDPGNERFMQERTLSVELEV
jgi:hypothetical protein